MSSDELRAAVRTVLSETSGSGAVLTARMVRDKVEERLGLPHDGLIHRKEELMALISEVLQQQGDGSSSSDKSVDPAAVKETVTALEDPDNGPTRAALLVAELAGASDPNAVAEAMVLLAEVCATSELAGSRLLEAKAAQTLALFIPPAAPKAGCSLAVRLLSAMALHAKLTAKIVSSAVLPPLLARIGTSIDGVGVQCATLLHNLADSPANRMRLLHGGALEVVTRIMVEPAASGGLKEHCLTAVHSLAGVTDEGLALPDIIGRLLGAKVPGTQKSALTALCIIREKSPGVEPRLAACEPLVNGLKTAAGSSDAALAGGAAEQLKALGIG